MNFAMAKAPIEFDIAIKGYEDVKVGVVKWPMSVIRLQCREYRIVSLIWRIIS